MTNKTTDFENKLGENTLYPEAVTDPLTTPGANLTTQGWYRIATVSFSNQVRAKGTNSWGATIFLQRSFNYNNNEIWNLSLVVAYNGLASLKVLNNAGTTRLYTRLRVVADLTTFEVHLEIYYNGTSANSGLATIYPAVNWDNTKFDTKAWASATLPSNNQILLDTALTAI